MEYLIEHGIDVSCEDSSGKKATFLKHLAEQMSADSQHNIEGGDMNESLDGEEEKEEEEDDQSIDGESQFYQFLLKKHRMPSFTSYHCSECGHILMEHETRYHCMECEDIDLCTDCAFKRKYLNAVGHRGRHKQELFIGGEDEEED